MDQRWFWKVFAARLHIEEGAYAIPKDITDTKPMQPFRIAHSRFYF